MLSVLSSPTRRDLIVAAVATGASGKRDLRGDRQAPAKVAGQRRHAEADGMTRLRPRDQEETNS